MRVLKRRGVSSSLSDGGKCADLKLAHPKKFADFSICVITCGFSICGLAHRINLWICDSRIRPRIGEFAICRPKYKFSCPPLAILEKKEKFYTNFL
jgi:hypothetical protein